MSYVKKEDSVFERDEKGELISKAVVLEGDPERREIRITPLTRGEWLKIRSEASGTETSKDQDADIIINHCLEPKYTLEEIKNLKPVFAQSIVMTIMKHSGLTFDKKDESDALKKS